MKLDAESIKVRLLEGDEVYLGTRQVGEAITWALAREYQNLLVKNWAKIDTIGKCYDIEI